MVNEIWVVGLVFILVFGAFGLGGPHLRRGRRLRFSRTAPSN